jgi:threonine/homoserine/homoserine lactone efflux protein
LVAVASGVTATLLAVSALGSLLIAGSAAYILWLAYHIATAPPLSAQRAAADAPSLAGGTVLGVANPKGGVAMAAVFASARLADTAATDAAAKTAVLAVMIVLIMTVWLIAGASLAPMLRDPQRARIVNAALAAAGRAARPRVPISLLRPSRVVQPREPSSTALPSPFSSPRTSSRGGDRG